MNDRIDSIDRKRGICIVHFHSEEIRQVPRTALRAAKIHTGMQIDPSAFDETLMRYMVPAAYARCSALLSIKSQTEYQLRESLAKACYPSVIIEKVISSLLDAGYLNDAVFAENWVSHRSASGIGKTRIRTELRMKGVPAEVIENVFALASEDASMLEEAEDGLKHAFEKAAHNRSLKDPKDRQKIIAALVRKGYSFSEAYRMIKENT